MAVISENGTLLSGKVTVGGVTFFIRNGKMVVRSATSEQPHRRTRKQFESRQRMANATVLWKSLRMTGDCLFEGGASSYGRFCTLMRKLPVVFLTKQERKRDGALLMPGLPVSDGPLAGIEYHLGEVEGVPALITSLKLAQRAGQETLSFTGAGTSLSRKEELWFYRLTQAEVKSGGVSTPVVYVVREVLDLDGPKEAIALKGIEFRNVGRRLALVGEVFGDDRGGWALVRVKNGQASSQTVVTRCTMYEQYLTDEALQRAAESYGGLTAAEEE